MYVGLTNDKPTNVMDVLVRTHAAEIAEAVQNGGDVTKVLLDAATNTIVELQGALARLLEMIPPDVRSTIDIDALIPDDDPGEVSPDVEQAALALLQHVASGEADEDTTVNLLCDIVDGQRLQNLKLCSALKKALDLLEANTGHAEPVRDDGGEP